MKTFITFIASICILFATIASSDAQYTQRSLPITGGTMSGLLQAPQLINLAGSGQHSDLIIDNVSSDHHSDIYFKASGSEQWRAGYNGSYFYIFDSAAGFAAISIYPSWGGVVIAENVTSQGSNNTMPNQTLTGSTSVLTAALADGRYGSPTGSIPFFSGSNGTSYIIRSTSNSLIYSCEGYVTFNGLKCSVKISPAYSSVDTHLFGYGIQVIGNCEWVQYSNQNLLFTSIQSRASGPSLQGYSNASSHGALQYTFSTPFSCTAGSSVVLSPSGHTFIADETLVSGTVVAVRDIMISSYPTTSDTSLKVNGGGSITTSYVSNSATNNGTFFQWVIYWNTTDGIRCYSSQQTTVQYSIRQTN